MATVQSILNKIASMASRTGLFSIQKGEFFGTLTDITNKISEVNNNLNSVAKSLIWQAPVANFAALGTTYPTPAIGWAAMVTDEGFIYSWNGTAWNNTGLTAFPGDVAVKSDINLVPVPFIDTTSSAYGFGFRDVSLVAGKTYTFTVEGSATEGALLKVFLFNNDYSLVIASIFVSGSNNKEISKTFTSPITHPNCRIAAYSADGVGTVTVKQYKLIEGGVSQFSEKLKNWILSDSYEVSSIIYDSHGVVASAIIKWPDEDGGSISDIVSNTHGITSIKFNRGDGSNATMTVNYSSTGVILSQSILVTI